MSPLLLAGGLFSAVCGVVAIFLLRAVEAQAKLAARISLVQQSAGLTNVGSVSSRSRLLNGLASLGTKLARSGLLSEKTLADLQQTLAVAGFRGSHGLGIFVGSKLVLLAVLPLVGWIIGAKLGLIPILHNCITIMLAIIGLLGPDYVVKRIRSGYLSRLDKGLPDALDMLVICSEAGLGLEPSITRVAIEISHTHPAVGTEFMQTASELRILSDRRLALLNMGTRTGLEGLKRLGSTLVQTTHYGTPVSHALRTLSAEMRTEVLTKFEERAARLPVLLTVPMIVFILPTIFVVVGGPAMIRVLSILHKH